MISPPTVHQFHSGSAPGDAITNSLRLVRDWLRALGCRSEIFVEHVAPELAGELRPHHELTSAAADLVLIHHSMGHALTDWVIALPQPKLLVYHNVTPASFFPAGHPMRAFAELGRRQLERFRPHMRGAIGDSDFNSDELRALGYTDVVTIPMLFDTDRLLAAPADRAPVDRQRGVFTLLFVGRVSPHKGHATLIDAFERFVHRHPAPAQLVFVGGYDGNDPHYQALVKQISTRGLGAHVVFTGKTTQDELHGWFRAADLYVSASEHEGFGVPLIEAMLFNLPVVAASAGSIAQTLGGAGLLTENLPPAELAALWRVLADDPALRRALARHQHARVDAFSPDRVRAQLVATLARHGVRVPGEVVATPRPALQIEGPAESTYSLAIVNRALAEALDDLAPGSVAVRLTEGPGDYPVDEAALAAKPRLHALTTRRGPRPRAALRNLHPPRVWDMPGRLNALHFAWEESLVPATWVADFNRFLDVVFVPTRFVQRTLVDNGVNVPVVVISHGIDHLATTDGDRAAHPAQPLPEGFRFLHVSSCFPRKGVDTLLEAWGRAFTRRDGVALVIKTFANPHNEIDRLLAEARSRFPELAPVKVILDDLAPAALTALYRACDAFVAPTRGEGFGLPLAEAMHLGLPVITTDFGGQRDFCTEETAWLVRTRFVESGSHLAPPGSLWLEPDTDDLVARLREVHRAAPAERAARVDAARHLVDTTCRWSRCAAIIRDTFARLDTPPPAPRPIKLGWISTWNERCGIAAYSGYLVDALPRTRIEPVILAADRGQGETLHGGLRVRPAWTENFNEPDLSRLEALIAEEGCEVVVVQFNFGFFHLGALTALLTRLEARGVRVILVFHSTADIDRPDLKISLRDHRAALARLSALLVHATADLNRFATLGLAPNTSLFTHGLPPFPAVPMATRREALGLPGGLLIASYGFLLPHKGVAELIEALPLLRERHPGARLLLVNALHPSAASAHLAETCRARIAELGLHDAVTAIHDFLPDAESVALLQAADVVVFPYQPTNESSSAAVRLGLASGRPVACTPLPIFENVRVAVETLPGFTPAEIARGLGTLASTLATTGEPPPHVAEWRALRAWPACAARLAALINHLARPLA